MPAKEAVERRRVEARGRASVLAEVEELISPLTRKEWGQPPPIGVEILTKYKVRYGEVYVYREKYYHKYHLKLPILKSEEVSLVRDALIRYLIEPGTSIEDLLRELGLPHEIVQRVRDEVLGLGVFEVFMDDPSIEDIQVIHAGNPIKIVHSAYGAMLTNIIPGEEYVNRIVRTALKEANIALTKIRPYRSFMGPRGYRFSVMMKSDIAPLTTSFVIRKPIRIWTLSALSKVGSIPPIMAGLLWLAFQEQIALLISGGMMTGKTSTSNAILSTIPPTATAVIIEDTPELTPPIKTLRRVPRQERGVEVTPFDLVVHALRESADYVIVGEVRGPEAAAWAQAILLGHGGLCLPEDQLVLMMVDGVIDLYKIGEVVRGVLEDKYKDVRVIALDVDGKPKWMKISRVVVKNGTKRFIRITSIGGVVHEVHEDHPVIVYENGRLREKKAKELKVGDKLVSLRSIPLPPLGQRLTSITIPEVLRKYINKLYVYGLSEALSNTSASVISKVAMVSYYTAYEWLKNTAIPLTRALKLLEENIITKKDLEKTIVLYGAKARWGIPYKIRLSRDFGYIIGLFLADGSMIFDSKDKLPRRVVFYIENDMDRISRAIKSLESIGIERGAIRIRKTRSKKAVALTVESKVFALLLHELLRGKVEDKDKSIPLDLAL
ncbi:MAG: Flp pilus assembly complex ATPase component TadA, partial [Desulfurococcales archaeon]|nr:Flp pilus assembly complex ATPase component TadA [Desulfurococcales archaeon]